MDATPLQTLRNLVRRLTGLWPLTWGGLCWLVASLVAFSWWGLHRKDQVLLAIGATGLTIFAVCLLSVLVGVLWVGLSLRVSAPGRRLEAECGTVVSSGFRLAAPLLLPFLQVRWEVTAPENLAATVLRNGRWLEERLHPQRRGQSDHIDRWITVQDAFGIGAVTFFHREERATRFVPSKGRLDQVHVIRGLASGDALSHPDGDPTGDPFDTRSYGAGDPIRYVLWKVFARTRELIVRTPERALSPADRTVAYLVTGEGDEAAAGTARVALESRALGEHWAFGTDGSKEPLQDRAQALGAIVDSAEQRRTDGGTGLTGFLDATTRDGARRAVLFVPSRPGPWLDRVRDTAARLGPGGLDLVVCTDGIGKAPAKGLMRWVRWAPPPLPSATSPTAPEDLAQVLKALRGVAHQLQVVDRQRGQVYPESHLARWMKP